MDWPAAAELFFQQEKNRRNQEHQTARKNRITQVHGRAKGQGNNPNEPAPAHQSHR
jgi:hypothetical protein